MTTERELSRSEIEYVVRQVARTLAHCEKDLVKRGGNLTQVRGHLLGVVAAMCKRLQRELQPLVDHRQAELFNDACPMCDGIGKRQSS